ncbi:MAG: DUF748 domain-containing protein, partial [Candidatus Binataceae bacterium]
LKITDSSFAYTDDATDPPYNLSVARLNGGITNFSNHFTAGTAKAAFTGQFMGSGKSSISGTFRPETEGPDFNLDLKLLDVDLPLLNNLFRAYGDFEVYSGQLSVYSQVTVRRGEMTGYVKPLFGKVQVYNAQQEKNKGVFHQLYEMTVGAVSKLLKNPGTRKVATKVNVSGRLANPNLSTWQAIVEFLHNAFVKAILPGFSHEPRIKPPPPGP